MRWYRCSSWTMAPRSVRPCRSGHNLETLHPNPPLMGTTAVEKAVISAWERRAYDEGMVGHAEIFRNSHPQFVDRGLPGHVDPVPQISALIERGKLRVARFHEKFNDQLSKNNFIAGEKWGQLSSAAGNPDLHLHLYRTVRVAEVAPHLLAHGTA